VGGRDTGRRSGAPRWARELLGWATAAALAIVVVAVVAASPRSELLFRDGDSLVTTLVVRSLALGQPQDWAMSSVLFLPEIAVLWLLSLLGLGINGTLALAGVVNVLALYGALRIAAGSALRTRSPIAGALLGLTGFALLAATEGSASRDALELAALLTTTTYYSASVVGAVLAVGLARRALDRRSVSGGDGSRRDGARGDFSRRDVSRGTPVAWGLAAALALVAAASVLTNPLFAAWVTVPLGAVLIVVALRRADAWWLVGALVAGSVAGYLARMPLANLIANTGAGYADPSQWQASLDYYGALLAERWNAPWGAASLLLIAVLWCWSVVATALLWRRRQMGAAVVAACGWVMPVLVTIGAIALGTHAARYLQPAVFAPLLALTVVPALLPERLPAARIVPAAVATALALAAAVGLGIPHLAAAATAPDRDLDCVVQWAEASGRTGAGQFWTVRLPKTHLADPRGLVQVDHQLRGYAWLVNRDDFAVGEVSFLVTDAQSPAFELPAGVSMSDAELIPCGRYTIADFGERTLPIGPLRS
jgi:hypothetical protein